EEHKHDLLKAEKRHAALKEIDRILADLAMLRKESEEQDQELLNNYMAERDALKKQYEEESDRESWENEKAKRITWGMLEEGKDEPEGMAKRAADRAKEKAAEAEADRAKEEADREKMA